MLVFPDAPSVFQSLTEAGMYFSGFFLTFPPSQPKEKMGIPWLMLHLASPTSTRIRCLRG